MKSSWPFVLTQCSHMKAEQAGVPTGKLLPNGRWQFSTRFHCPDCDVYFTEQHNQIRPPDLSARIEDARDEVRRLRALVQEEIAPAVSEDFETPFRAS